MNRISIRLPEYDYSQGGCYFITICTKDKISYFGEITCNTINLSRIGLLAAEYWQRIPVHFLNVKLDKSILMPNHIHGLLWLKDDRIPVGAQYIEPLQKVEYKKHKFQKTIPKSFGSIIRSYKASVTRWCNKNDIAEFRWQRNYYERIIRNERELNAVREYISNNPVNWGKDEYSA